MKRLITIVSAFTFFNTAPVMSCGLLQAIKNKFSRNRVHAAPAPVAAAPAPVRIGLTLAEREQLADDVAAAHRREFALAVLEMRAASQRFARN